MQTFLPYPNVVESLKTLDYRRLGKQRVEAGQILVAIRQRGGAWYNHPATQMWLRYADFLEFYRSACISEWIRRGYKNTLIPASPFLEESHVPASMIPWWYGMDAFHTSHKSNLLRKLPAHYGPLFPDVSAFLPYYWPSAYPS